MTRVQFGARSREIGFTPWAGPLLFGCACLLFGFYAFQFWGYAEDDVFIPMRYALNFWRGAGWVMNPGERVEGCTSPLQLALVTALIRFLTPDQSLWASKIVGLAVGIGVLWQARRLGRVLLPGAPRLTDGIPLLVALWPEFALSMTNGLETGLAALLLTAGMADFIACHREARASWSRAALLFLGAGLARPELTPLFPLLLLGSALCGLRSRQAWIALSGYLAAVVLLLWLRWAYYGAFVPNTYWAKRLSAAQALPLGVAYLQQYALPGGPVLGTALYGLGLWAVVRRGGRARLALPTALGLHLLFLLRSGGDWMMDGRFFVVVLPLCAAVWMGSVQTLCDLATRTGRRYALLVVVALTGFAAQRLSLDANGRAATAARQPGVTDLPTALSPQAPLEEWKPGNHPGRLAIARWVAAHAVAGQYVLTSEMGLVTVVNPDVRFLDIRGLTDRHIARITGYRRDLSGVQAEREWMNSAKPLGAYVRVRRPEWVALLWDVYRRDKVGTEAENDLYVPAGTFPILCDGRTLTVATWRRRDADGGDLAAARRPSIIRLRPP